MRIGIVVQRYGPEVVGGAERLARGLAEGLARKHDVEVLTTCALSYRTWANHYPEGRELVAGVVVRRFRTERERDIDEFNALSERLFSDAGRTPEQERAWLDAQGPFVPALLDHLHAAARDFDRLIFFTYLYYPTVHGVHVAPERSVLVPTAHDEAPFWMQLYRPVFTLPAGLVFNTRAEQRLVRRRFPRLDSAAAVIGVGVDGIDRLERARLEHAGNGRSSRSRPQEPTSLLYAGRIEQGKGVGELIEMLRRYRARTRRPLRLRLMGETAMQLPPEPWIEPLGFVSEDDKARHLAAATLLLAPSRLESFGIVLLEAFAAGTPVLANAASEAFVEHCRASGAGLWYRDEQEFGLALDLLLGDARLRRALAQRGPAYVRERFSWPAVCERYERFLTDLG